MADYITYNKRLNYLLEMIQKGRLSSLEQAAHKYECSKRTIKRMISMLREQGHNIGYCKAQGRFLEINCQEDKFWPP